jgi:hypothetical protein
MNSTAEPQTPRRRKPIAQCRWEMRIMNLRHRMNRLGHQRDALRRELAEHLLAGGTWTTDDAVALQQEIASAVCAWNVTESELRAALMEHP